MTSYAEGKPSGSDEFDVEAHLAPNHSVNFGAIFMTYDQIRNGELLPSDAGLWGYQEFLLRDPNGMAIRQALDRVTTDDRNQGLVSLTMNEIYTDAHGISVKAFMEEIKTVLPPDFDLSLLNDPRIEEAA